MKNLNLLVLAFLCACGTPPAPRFESAGLWDRPYNKVAFLTAHNSYSNFAQGWVYAQQNLSITKQLEFGVRGLMLDVHWAQGGRNGELKPTKEVRLCHEQSGDGNCSFTRTVLKNLVGPPLLENAFIEIKNFLKRNPNEVITIFFESYIPDENKIFDVLKKLKMKKNVFIPNKNISKWPTINSLTSDGKNIVLFSNQNQGIVPYTWNHVTETVFNLDDDEACLHRSHSLPFGPKNDLQLINHFYPISIDNPFDLLVFHNYKKVNAFERLKTRINKCHQISGRYPNFIALDFVEVGKDGGGMALVNWINDQYE